MPPKRKNASNQEVKQLISLMQKMVASSQPASSGRRRRKRASKKRPMSVGKASQPDGVISISRSELLKAIVLPKNTAEAKGHIDIVPGSFSFLANVANSFEQLRWDSLQFFYKPAVGTTYGGLVSFGVDWDFSSSDLSRDKISGFTPNQTCAAWQDTEKNPMVCPVGRLRNVPWYLPNSKTAGFELKGPGKLMYAVNGTSPTTDFTVGELWARYRVTMQGTNPS